MRQAKTMSVKVGLPAGESGTSALYDEGQSVLEVGIAHEFGAGRIPMRSFLRGPMREKSSEIERMLAVQFNLVLEAGLDVGTALGRVGLTARNISVGAFRTKGYGEWQDISQATKDKKGSTAILIDTGILRSAITWAVE